MDEYRALNLGHTDKYRLKKSSLRVGLVTKN